MSNVEEEHENRVLGGYKAALSNPHVSEEAKAHAEAVLVGHDTAGSENQHPQHGTHHGDHDHDGGVHQHEHHTQHHHPSHHGLHDEIKQKEGETKEAYEHRLHVIAGYKSLTPAGQNLEQSEQAKAHAVKVLKEEHGIDVTAAHEHHVLGGYKAALHNPKVSEEAKEHAKAVLADHGVQA